MKNTISLAQMRTWQTGMLQSAVHRYAKRLADDYLEQYGLSSIQWLIIGTILENQSSGIRITDLAEKAGTTASFMTNVINRLVKRKIVIRTVLEQDNRVKALRITPEFQPTCLLIEEGLREVFRANLYNRVSREQLEAYVAALQLLAGDQKDR